MSEEAPSPLAALRASATAHRKWVRLAAGLLLVGVLAGGLLRFGAETPAGQALVLDRIEHLSLGSLGRLRLDGVKGDVWRDFTVDRAEIIDAQGPWFIARGLKVRWRWPDLLHRQVHLRDVSAAQMQVLRRPRIAASGPSSGPLPVSLLLDHFATQLETLPAFSGTRGLFQINASLNLRRSGGLSGALNIASLLHADDGLRARFNLGGKGAMLIDAQAQEGRGGALAGSIGLPSTESFLLSASASGDKKGGRLYLLALSGDHPIAQADAAWDKRGGRGSGRISLAASSLTAGYQRQFGPELRLSGAGRSVAPGLYAMVLKATADNVALTASGVIEPAKRATHGGVHLLASLRAPNEFIPFPTLGALSLDGALTGNPDDWRLTGKGGADGLALAGLTLAHVSGPIDLQFAKRELHIQSTLDGEGGHGDGWFAAAEGARPKLAVDLTRQADGRLLIRSLKNQGDALRIDAGGERSLFGALTFKGVAELNSLAPVYKSARGGLTARWTAEQHTSRTPWSFVFDAQGAKVATGFTQLDSLLGPNPRLHVDATLVDKGLRFDASELKAPTASAQATGLLGWDLGLDMALKWAAHGPFEAGPLEFAGDASGAGTLAGSLGAPRADLKADFQTVDLPGLTLHQAHMALTLNQAADGLSGDIAVTGVADHGPAHAKGAFRFAGDDIVLTGIDTAYGGATAAGSIALRDKSPSSADIAFAVGPGAFALQGHAEGHAKITEAPGGPVADIHVTMTDFAVPNSRPGAPDVMLRDSSLIVTSAALTATGPLSRLSINGAVDAGFAGMPFKLKGAGLAVQGDGGYAVSFQGSGRFRKADFRTQSPGQVAFGSRGLSAKLDLALGGGQVALDARQGSEDLDAKVTLSGVDLGALGEDLAGRVNADIALSGRGAILNGVMTAHLDGARSRDAPAALALAGDVRAVLTGSRLTVDATAGGAQAAGMQSGDGAKLALSLPAEASAQPFRIALDRTKPIEGGIDANGELQPIWDLFFGDGRELGGRLSAHAAIGGDLNAPKFSGAASLAQGRFEDAATGLKLRNLNAALDLRDNAVDVRQFSGADASGGTMSGQGRVSLQNGAASTFSLALHNFRLLDNDQAKVAASGAVTVVAGADGKSKLTGGLTLDRADITAASDRRPAGVVTLDVVEHNKPGVANLQTQPSSHTPQVGLDISIRAPGKVFVRGLGLNAEMSVNAQVTGTTDAPVLSGVARVVRGDYDLAGKRFEIDNSGLVYLASTPDKIRLDLTATLEATNITAVIKIGGTAAKPDIKLSSTPTLPSDEILSQVLFGQSAAQLSPVEAAQLASSVAALATGGGFDVMGGLRNFARLDRLALSGGETNAAGVTTNSGVTVSGGKYIGNNVYLELTGGGRLGPSAQVEYRANRSLSLISQVGGETGAKLSVRWRIDYGRSKKSVR